MDQVNVTTKTEKIPAGLYLVATPIGNLNDISQRALSTLSQVDAIYCEDTRHSRKLLNASKIYNTMHTLHDHNEAQLCQHIVKAIQAGQSIAVISDAGTPLINDPGYKLVKAAHQANLMVTAVPGPCALITALTLSHLPTDDFRFIGFLPTKSVARKKQFYALENMPYTTVMYESPHRILASVQDIIDTLGPKKIIGLAKELTKQFETVITAPAQEILDWLTDDIGHQKGEFVIMISGTKHKDNTVDVPCAITPKDLVLSLNNFLPPKDAAKIAAQLTGINKNQLYQLLIQRNDLHT